MAGILRGDVYWGNLDLTQGHEQSGRRPVLVLSEGIFNARSGTVIAVALTSKEPQAGFPLTTEIVDGGLPKRSWATMSQIRTLSTSRLAVRIGSASPEELTTVLYGLIEILGG